MAAETSKVRLAWLVENVKHAFSVLRSQCPHRDDVDCAHSAMKFNRMLCAEYNCPLLLGEGDGC